MKILHILYSGLGGHGSVFFSFIRDKNRGDFQYEATFNGIEEMKQEYVDECNAFDVPWNFVGKRKGFDLGYYRKLAKTIRKSDADIVFLHSSAYILPARLANLFSKKKKSIVVRETQANQLKSKMEWFWLAITMLWANHLVLLSEAYHAEITKKLRWFYRSSKVKVIPNGIDLEFFKPCNRTASKPTVFGMQSRLVPIKDHLTLLEAFSLLKRSAPTQGRLMLLKIAGDGAYKDKLLERAAALQLEDAVEFSGMIVEKDLPDFLCSLDIYVHASLGETMSTAIMQAMACGLPVIASEVVGIDNMIQNGVTGLMVPVRDARSLADAMGMLNEDNNKKTALSVAARKYAEKYFSNERMLIAYGELFDNPIKDS